MIICHFDDALSSAFALIFSPLPPDAFAAHAPLPSSLRFSAFTRAIFRHFADKRALSLDAAMLMIFSYALPYCFATSLFIRLFRHAMVYATLMLR